MCVVQYLKEEIANRRYRLAVRPTIIVGYLQSILTQQQGKVFVMLLLLLLLLLFLLLLRVAQPINAKAGQTITLYTFSPL